MAEIAHQAEALFYGFVTLCVHLLELVGVMVIMVSAIKAVIAYLQSDTHFNLQLAEGMSLGLEFKLGGEILRTVVVRDWSEMALVGAIIVLRAILAVLIHWEIKGSQELHANHHRVVNQVQATHTGGAHPPLPKSMRFRPRRPKGGGQGPADSGHTDQEP